MPTQLAEAKLIDHRTVQETVTCKARVGDAAIQDHEFLLPMRGIVIALLISVPLWALIGFVIYLVL